MVVVPIVVDTRERKPYEFPGVSDSMIIERRLDVGDYTLDGYENDFSVERKTLNDLATSLGSDRERFEDEIRRAQSLDDFVVVIEADEYQVYDYEDKSYCPSYYSNIHPNSVIGTVEKWPTRKYDTLEFVWASDRDGGMEETLRRLDEWYVSARNL